MANFQDVDIRFLSEEDWRESVDDETYDDDEDTQEWPTDLKGILGFDPSELVWNEEPKPTLSEQLKSILSRKERDDG